MTTLLKMASAGILEEVKPLKKNPPYTYRVTEGDGFDKLRATDKPPKTLEELGVR